MAKQISFSELFDQNDSETMVWTALVMADKDLKPMNEWFHKIGLIPEGKNLIDWAKVTGNVRGDEGRSDIMLKFDHPELSINPMVRLQIGDLKWTSDFVVNYRCDYNY